MAKKKHEEHENHERWLVSYADFITLLFAFFVVMYSISSVNEGKFRTVSESIKAALNPIVSPSNTPVPFTIGPNKPLSLKPAIEGAKEPAVRRLRQILHSLQNETQLEIIQLKELTNGDIVLTLPDTVLFRSGESNLRPEARPFIQAISEVLIELDRHVRVEGHTDNVPIHTDCLDDNWDLSAMRATAVVRMLQTKFSVAPSRLTAGGRSEYVPKTSNETADSRSINRRTEIIILPKLDQFFELVAPMESLGTK